MYPETDIEVKVIDAKYLNSLKSALPLTVSERETLYKKYGLSKNLIEGMKLDNWACFFEKKVKEGYDATRIAIVLLEDLTKLKREGIETENISEEMISEFLKSEKNGKFTKEVSLDVLKKWASYPEKSIDEIISSLEIKKAGKNELEDVIEKIISKNESLVKEQGERAIGALMGDAMKELKGKVSGQEISEILRKKIREQV